MSFIESHMFPEFKTPGIELKHATPLDPLQLQMSSAFCQLTSTHLLLSELSIMFARMLHRYLMPIPLNGDPRYSPNCLTQHSAQERQLIPQPQLLRCLSSGLSLTDSILSWKVFHYNKAVGRVLPPSPALFPLPHVCVWTKLSHHTLVSKAAKETLSALPNQVVR